MAKFCRACGAALQEGDKVCPNCGADLEAKPVAQSQPQAKQPSEALNKVSDVLNTVFTTVEKYLMLAVYKLATAITNAKAAKAAQPAGTAGVPQKDSSLNIVRLAIAAVMIVLCLIGTIMNLTMKYEVSVTMSATYNGEKVSQSASGPIGDLADSDEFIGFILVNLLWAVFNIVVLVMAIILVLKVLKLANSDKNYQAVTLTALIGDVLYMILYKICGSGTESYWGTTMNYTVGYHYFTWIHVVFFALAFALCFVGKLAAAAPAAVESAPETPAE